MKPNVYTLDTENYYVQSLVDEAKPTVYIYYYIILRLNNKIIFMNIICKK